MTIVSRSTLSPNMDQTVLRPARPTCHNQVVTSEEFHTIYERKSIRGGLPLLSSVDGSSSAEAHLYRVLLPHGKVDRLVDLDPYDIQSFCEKNAKEFQNCKTSIGLPGIPEELPAVLLSPPTGRPSGLYNDTYRLPPRPYTYLGATSCDQQIKGTYRITHCHSLRAEYISNHKGYYCAPLRYAQDLTSLKDDDTSDVSLFEGDTDAIKNVNEGKEMDCFSDPEIGCLREPGRLLNRQAANVFSLSDVERCKKARFDDEARLSNGISLIKGPKRVTTTSSATLSATASSATYSDKPQLKGRRSWTDEEHTIVLQELQLIRAKETRYGVARKKWCTGIELWGKIARALHRRNLESSRTPLAVSLYWNRYGRVRSGFDERRTAETIGTFTSAKKSRTDRE